MLMTPLLCLPLAFHHGHNDAWASLTENATYGFTPLLNPITNVVFDATRMFIEHRVSLIDKQNDLWSLPIKSWSQSDIP